MTGSLTGLMTAPSAGVVLSVDFGSSTTVGVVTVPGRPPRLVGVDGQPWMPSAVFADQDDGLVVGTDAARLARTDPARFEPTPKRRIDDGEVLLGSEVVPVPELISAVLRRVIDEASRQLGNQQIETLVLTHPADWGSTRQALLRKVGHRFFQRVQLVPEPVAAAGYFTATTGLPMGSTMAVYDLGAGTFDAAVVRRDSAGFSVLACGGLPDLGGLDLDQRLFQLVGQRAAEENESEWANISGAVTNSHSPQHRRLLRVVRDDVRAGKESLSRRPYVDMPLPPPLSDVHVTREEFERLIADDVARSVLELETVILAAGYRPAGLHAINFVGGATRTPLCGQVINQKLGVVPVATDQPETVVALGAIRAVVTDPDASRPLPGAGAGSGSGSGQGPSTPGRGSPKPAPPPPPPPPPPGPNTPGQGTPAQGTPAQPTAAGPAGLMQVGNQSPPQGPVPQFSLGLPPEPPRKDRSRTILMIIAGVLLVAVIVVAALVIPLVASQ